MNAEDVRSMPCSATRRQITLGAFAPPLVEQLKGLAKKKDLRTCDLLSRAISMLKIQGVLSDREASNARRRLVKRIERTLIVSPNVRISDGGLCAAENPRET